MTAQPDPQDVGTAEEELARLLAALGVPHDHAGGGAGHGAGASSTDEPRRRRRTRVRPGCRSLRGRRSRRPAPRSAARGHRTSGHRRSGVPGVPRVSGDRCGSGRPARGRGPIWPPPARRCSRLRRPCSPPTCHQVRGGRGRHQARSGWGHDATWHAPGVTARGTRHDVAVITVPAARTGRARRRDVPVTVALGVDVGGTKIAAGVVDEDGTLLSQKRVGLPGARPRRHRRGHPDRRRRAPPRPRCRLRRPRRRRLRRPRPVHGVYAPNLAWHDVAAPRRARADPRHEGGGRERRQRRRLGRVPVRRRARLRQPPARHRRHRRGGRVVLDGELVRGGFGMAMEVGHLRFCPVDNSAAAASRGAGSSTRAAPRWCARPARRGPRPTGRALLERSGGDPVQISGPMVTPRRWRRPVLHRHAAPARIAGLGEGLAMLSTVLDPGAHGRRRWGGRCRRPPARSGAGDLQGQPQRR